MFATCRRVDHAIFYDKSQYICRSTRQLVAHAKDCGCYNSILMAMYSRNMYEEINWCISGEIWPVYEHNIARDCDASNDCIFDVGSEISHAVCDFYRSMIHNKIAGYGPKI